MKELEEISKLQDEDYKRLVGVSKADFQFLLMRLQHLQEDDKKRNPMKSRGIKGNLTLEHQLLLTFYYLRHYATFQILGGFFGISESYCCKVYQKISRYLLRILVTTQPLLNPKDDLEKTRSMRSVYCDLVF